MGFLLEGLKIPALVKPPPLIVREGVWGWVLTEGAPGQVGAPVFGFSPKGKNYVIKVLGLKIPKLCNKGFGIENPKIM